MTSHRLDAARAAALLEEVMPVGGGEAPLAVVGWRDTQGRMRRVRADYPNGWRLEFRISAAGNITSQSAAIRLRGEIRGGA